MKEIRMLQSSWMGYGNISRRSIEEALKWKPHLIIGQGTSTDPGPGYLGSDKIYPYHGVESLKRDFGLSLTAAYENGLPFIHSTGNPSGSDLQLEGAMRVIDEITKENHFKFRIAVISGEINKEYINQKILDGIKIKRLVNTSRLRKNLTLEDVVRSKRIVAQMGPEPIMKALNLDIDGIITGRALDIGLHMAYPLKQGFEKGLVAQMGKTIECGTLCAVPPTGADNIFAFLRSNHFLVRPPNPDKKCTVMSVAGHAFYERPDITKELNPGGYLDISDAKYEQYDERTVKVSGGKWVPTKYTIKLEGVALMGYRTISIVGVRDPNLVGNINGFLQEIKDQTKHRFRKETSMSYKLVFHTYGKDAVLGSSEFITKPTSHELGIVVDVIAETQSLAHTICAYVRGRLFFNDYPDKKTTAGNVAVMFSPGDIDLGPTYAWSIWHALPLEDPCEPFRVKVIDFPRS